MVTESIDGWLVVVVAFHLLVFGIALLMIGLYALAHAALVFLRRFPIYSDIAQSTGERIAEIGSIGQQTRHKMQQMSFDFLYSISNNKRR